MAISDELRKLVDPNNECCCEHCLSNKCKEWANKKYKACLISGYCKSFSYKCFTDNPYELQYIKKVETQTADTEPEAIFKACEYILKEQSCNQLT